MLTFFSNYLVTETLFKMAELIIEDCISDSCILSFWRIRCSFYRQSLTGNEIHINTHAAHGSVADVLLAPRLAPAAERVEIAERGPLVVVSVPKLMSDGRTAPGVVG